jgi:hypothetical protein
MGKYLSNWNKSEWINEVPLQYGCYDTVLTNDCKLTGEYDYLINNKTADIEVSAHGALL